MGSKSTVEYRYRSTKCCELSY